MTAVLPSATVAPALKPVAPARYRPAISWSWRLIRRGVLLMWLGIAGYLVVEVLAFRSAYPTEAARQNLLQLSQATSIRMLEGAPGSIDRAGGYAVWHSGWLLGLIVGCWAILTVTRQTRGEEDAGRAELVLSSPLSPRQLLVASLVSMAFAIIGIAAAAALPLIAFGEPVEPAVLWGLGLAMFATFVTALAAVCAQLLQPRRRASSLAMAVVVAGFLLRSVANSSEQRAWLLTLSPYGWLDELHAFAENRWWWLAAPLLATIALAGLAVLLSGRRDTGASLVRSFGSDRSRFTLLGSARAFGWRLTAGTLLAWGVGLAVTSLVLGLMVGAVVEFIGKDATYRRLLASMGMDLSAPVVGYLSYLAMFLALPLALFTGWRLGAVRAEEAAGRLDNLLVRGLIRWRWLSATAVLALLASLLLVAVSTAGMWAGAVLANAQVSAAQVIEPMAGTVPMMVLFVGISTLAFGLAPRCTVAVPVSLAVLGYLLDTFGAMLHWPKPVLTLSPFQHLARLPGTPMTATAAITMCALGLVAAAVGVLAFTRRDLRGG